MFAHFISRAGVHIRIAGISAFAIGGAWPASAAAPAQAPTASQVSSDCDRACLRQALDNYLAAVFKHDPGAAGLSAGHFATEDTVVIHDGDGFWKTVAGYGAVQRRFFDPVNETAAFLGLFRQGGQEVITSVRIRVEGGKVSEAEWIYGRQGMMARGTADIRMFAQAPPSDAIVPAAERASRFLMIALANNYFQANKNHDASWLPDDPDCTRLENGVGQQRIAPAGDAGAALPGPPPMRGCLGGFANMDNLTTDVALRRFTVVDEEAGMVLGTGIYVRYAGSPVPHNLVSEYFQIRNGKIHGIWSAMHFLPMGAPDSTGWEDRHGFWR
jgi:hypothetical protein